jgi:glycosyltransferase involved in cell wall biosynthesis
LKKQGTPLFIRNSKTPKVSVIIPVMNERKTLARVIQQARRVHQDIEIIIVANGSRDGSKELAYRTGAKVISFAEPLGHDVGRSVGAREARGDIILFLDGDMVIPARQLRSLVCAVKSGVDVALNSYSGITRKKEVHQVALAKHALNAILNRSDLRGASLTTIPHAISRKALNIIGAEHLAIPPKAHAIAIQKGLKVSAVHYINVLPLNPLRRRSHGEDPLGKLILGDHLEAINWMLKATNARGAKTDLNRIREMVR